VKSKTGETTDSLCTASAHITSLISNPLPLRALLSDCKTPWSVSYGSVTGELVIVVIASKFGNEATALSVGWFASDRFKCSSLSAG